MPGPLPSSAQPIGMQGSTPVLVTPVWQRWFNSLLSAAPSSAIALAAGSPFAYTAGNSGHLLVQGGTVSAITLQRGNVVTPTGLIAGFIPVANGDIVSITYSSPPNLTFFPS